MSIVPIRGKWKINIRKIDGTVRTIEIDQDATVRKLYSAVRHDLKVNWGINDSIQLVNGSTYLVKNDSKMNAVGIYNGITLNVVIQSGPYSWDLFVRLPGRSSASTVTLYERQTCKDLYKKVMELQDSSHPLCIIDPAGHEIPEENINLCERLYDGALLTSKYIRIPLINLIIMENRSFIITVPSNCYVKQVFQEVLKKINHGEEILEEMCLVKENVYLDQYMDRRINDLEVDLSDFSSIRLLMRVRGGSDPRVQMLQNCPNKDVIGVSTPSIRACPFCGALVQHIDACKQMNCPACSRAFCFICLKKNEGWQCGSWNTKCTLAPRQMYIPR